MARDAPAGVAPDGPERGCRIVPVGVIGSRPTIDTGQGRVIKFARGLLSGPVNKAHVYTNGPTQAKNPS
ncbi:hypothetical protein E2562_014278 [Oryza meyeriana var. granulata]|uniref:Uncharacterized protein n=1 Tax=Oryza meyeriana var. granulata TaxID=110450 RepID=A0A6G1C5Y7_9ORYZ|nr:hypothetical protein E2562_014278 [Oryza meyeriana var. granulata]